MDKFRRTGRTTRVVDDAIQRLFKNKEILVLDHYSTFEASHMAYLIVRNRLLTEHNIGSHELIINRKEKGFLIKLK